MTSLCVSFMKYLLIGLLASALLASATMFATQSRQTFSGTITDEECPIADHSGMRMGPTDTACAIACVQDHGGQFVFFDGKEIYRLSDQDKSKELAGQKVTVIGTLDPKTKTIQVDSMTAAAR
jgi:type 1 fimbria pilin